MRYKYALLTLFIACFLTILSNSMSNSQTVYKHIFLHQNRKNDSQIKSSPISSGYDNNISLDFCYEPIPTEAMKKRAKAIFGDQGTTKTDEDNEASSIFGISNLDDFSYGEQSTILKDLEAEANQTILKQQAEQEKQYKEKLKRNVASYTASVEAKKKRDREAAERKDEQEENPEKPKSPFDYYEEQNDDNSESYEIITGSDGKIRIKSPGSTSTSNSSNPTASSPNNI